MTTTLEEALEQGWHTPVPTFFGTMDTVDGQAAHDWFRTCNRSPWIVTMESDPKAVLDESRPVVRMMREQAETKGRVFEPSPELIGSLPHYVPVKRPVRYVNLAWVKGYR